MDGQVLRNGVLKSTVDSTRESDRRLDRRRGSSHALRLGLLLFVFRSIEHARPDRRGGKLIRGHLVRAIKHRKAVSVPSSKRTSI